MGERFGLFELGPRLGAGGMAETFAATRRGPGGFEQRLCLKRILPVWQGDARFVRMFLEEARIAARLRHATIVQVIEAGEADGVPYLALELIDGVDMRRLIDHAARTRATPLTAEHVALIAIELATALEIAHREGVIHRDVSPANVLLSIAGEVKLADFGIAKAEDSARLTRTGLPKGKPSYMAPEYAAGAPACARTDLYSLGVTLYEIATGTRPFRARTEIGELERAKAADRAHVTALAPGLPPALATAIERLVQPDPEARFASAAELFDALGDVTPIPGARRRLGARVRAAALVSADSDTTVACGPPAVRDEITRAPRRRG